MNQCDLEIYEGDDFAAWVTVLNYADGSPANLAGYTAQAQIRTGSADQSPAVSAELLATVVAPNFISLYLAAAETLLLSSLYYVWDLQLITDQAMTYTIMAGNVTITSEVTREPTSLAVLSSVSGREAVWPVPTLQQPLPAGWPFRVPLDPRVLRVRAVR